MCGFNNASGWEYGLLVDPLFRATNLFIAILGVTDEGQKGGLEDIWISGF